MCDETRKLLRRYADELRTANIELGKAGKFNLAAKTLSAAYICDRLARG